MSENELVTPPTALPHLHTRNITIEGITLDANDLVKLLELCSERNAEAQDLQIKYEGVPDENRDRFAALIKEYFLVDYAIHDTKQNRRAGYVSFPRDFEAISSTIQKIFIGSSTSFENNANRRKPANHLGIYLNFERPPLALNLINLPSNPTDNNSIANVYGFDENWVIVTEKKIQEFFEQKKSNYQGLHRGGVYDVYLYFIFIPITIWIAYKVDAFLPTWSTFGSPILTVAAYGYMILIPFILARLSFQYMRWLFPVVEYRPKRVIAPFLQKGVLGVVATGLLGGALLDLLKALL